MWGNPRGREGRLEQVEAPGRDSLQVLPLRRRWNNTCSCTSLQYYKFSKRLCDFTSSDQSSDQSKEICITTRKYVMFQLIKYLRASMCGLQWELIQGFPTIVKSIDVGCWGLLGGDPSPNTGGGGFRPIYQFPPIPPIVTGGRSVQEPQPTNNNLLEK